MKYRWSWFKLVENVRSKIHLQIYEHSPSSSYRRRYKDPRLCYRLVAAESFCQHWPVRLQVYGSEYTLLWGHRDHYRSSCRSSCWLSMGKDKETAWEQYHVAHGTFSGGPPPIFIPSGELLVARSFTGSWHIFDYRFGSIIWYILFIIFFLLVVSYQLGGQHCYYPSVPKSSPFRILCMLENERS